MESRSESPARFLRREFPRSIRAIIAAAIKSPRRCSRARTERRPRNGSRDSHNSLGEMTRSAASAGIKGESISRRVELQIEAITRIPSAHRREPGVLKVSPPRNEFIRPGGRERTPTPLAAAAPSFRPVSSKRSESTPSIATPTDPFSLSPRGTQLSQTVRARLFRATTRGRKEQEQREGGGKMLAVDWMGRKEARS